MINQKKGAAPRQGHRANGEPARSRTPRPSVAELRDDDRFRGRVWTVATTVVGAILLYALMFVAGC